MIPVEKHIEDIINLIPKHPIFTFKDIFVYYKGCTRQWAYILGIDKNDTIKELVYDNKRKGVSSLLARWVKSSNPTLSIAAMRLLSDDDERKMLSMTHTDVTSGGKTITSRYDEMSVEEMEAELERVKKL
jgi:hypothetical protein